MAVLRGTWPVIALVAIAWLAPQLGSRWFHRVERALARLSRRRRLCIALTGLLALILGAGISLLTHIPQPWGHDEFSYLLAADTFAHGRLANPTHPLWIHFESIHIIQQPTYASKYPPAQGLALALGQVLAGQPVVGLWLSVAVAVAAICWMFYAWLPPRWALLGGLLAALHPTMLSWSQRYFGGAIAVTGGALVLGALRRILAGAHSRDAWLMGLGITLLANSRPYEGAVLSGIVLLVLLTWKPRVLFRRIVPPVVAVLAFTGIWIAYYNWRVTGDPFQLPYALHEQQYGMTPLFVWQHPRSEPIAYRHDAMREFHLNVERAPYELQCSAAGLAHATLKKLDVLFQGAVPLDVLRISLAALLLPAAALPWLLRNRWTRLALLIGGVFTAGLLLETWMNPHYAAPIAGLVFMLGVQALRQVRAWHVRGRPCGRLLVRTAVIICIAAVVPSAVQIASSDAGKGWPLDRAGMLAQLRQTNGRHLIIVRYGPTHSPLDEWVYNDADIDGAAVVWARDMGEAGNRDLLAYFRERRIWSLDADVTPRRLVPYPQPADL